MYQNWPDVGAVACLSSGGALKVLALGTGSEAFNVGNVNADIPEIDIKVDSHGCYRDHQEAQS